MRTIPIKKLTRLALLTCVAVVLGYVEYLVPLTAVPGIKLGLSNTVILYVLLLMDAGSAALLTVLKVGLSGLLFGGVQAMVYSAAGGILSLSVMLLMRRVKAVGTVGISISGALAHNMGQLAVACFMVESRAILVYLPVLIASAAVTGALTGVVAQLLIKALKKTKAENANEKK